MREPTDILTFADRYEWRTWLEAHHADRNEAWLAQAKKSSRKALLTYQEALEEALCFGWIDSLGRRVDVETFVLRYTPRKRGSVWSESNKRRVEKLIREGRMTEAGLASIVEARANGQWEAAAQREQVDTLPADLEWALQQHPGAPEAYLGQPASKKKQWLYWISTAKRPETRIKRVQEVVRHVVETLHVDQISS